jgi:mannose-6-phosphate isomerase-like protein (cupin superfamily)
LKNSYNILKESLRDILQGQQNTSAFSMEEEIEKSEEALLKYAQAHAVAPPLSLKDKILGNIQKLNELSNNRQVISLDNVPLISPESNWLDWEEAVKSIERPADIENVYFHPLRNDDVVEMNLAWVVEEVPEEVHHDILESFILLDGTCECHIFNEDGSIKKVVRMRAGDYISFKIGEVHDIHITSGVPAKAILQWLKVAA